MTNGPRNVFVGLVALLLTGCAGYQHKANGWAWTYWDEGTGRHELPVDGADAGTFSAINQEYAKDKTFVYYRATRVPNASVSTFHLLAAEYWADEARVFLRGYDIEGAKPKSFIVFHESIWSRDATHVFYDGLSVPEADPNSFLNGLLGCAD